MIDDALAKLDSEILRQQALLDGLKWARSTIAAEAPEPSLRAQPLLIEGPKPKKQRKAEKPKRGQAAPKRDPQIHYSHTFEVNGVDVPCTEQQAAMLEMLEAAEGDSCVNGSVLMPIFDNSKGRMRNAIEDCCVQLMAAKATIQGVKSLGCRLINVEA